MPWHTAPLVGAGLALLIGLLIGLEREHSQTGAERPFAGIRTFPLLALAGFLGGLAARQGQTLVLPAVLLAVAALTVVAYRASPPEHTGATTEAVALVVPLLGALVAWDQADLAAALAVAVTLLLALKPTLHDLAGRVSRNEILAMLKFGVVALVLVPLLPDKPVGPYAALVPRQVGLMVLVLCGVSLAGYLLVRLLGGTAGWAWAGLLGGLVSSTAVTLSFAGTARTAPALARPLSAGVLLATSVLYARGLLLAAVFDSALAWELLGRFTLLALAGLAFALPRLRTTERVAAARPLELRNPVELGQAAALALVFAGVLLAARAAQAELGERGLQAVAFMGGLGDVDAVLLAAARLHLGGSVALGAAAGAVLLATLANTLVKTAAVVFLGGPELRRATLPGFTALALLTIVLLWVG